MNKVWQIGRLCSEPELKTTQGGVSVTSFNIAVKRKYGDKQTDFFTIVAWRNTAEFICKYFSKGQMISIIGELQARKYEAKNGEKRTAIEIVASEVEFCGENKKADQHEADLTYEEVQVDDDLPF